MNQTSRKTIGNRGKLRLAIEDCPPLDFIALHIEFFNCSPWDQVSNLTINGKKVACSSSDLVVCELLGRGAYGTVHRMVHKATNTTMAVKVLNRFHCVY